MESLKFYVCGIRWRSRGRRYDRGISPGDVTLSLALLLILIIPGAADNATQVYKQSMPCNEHGVEIFGNISGTAPR